jgi:hypothetical protein
MQRTGENTIELTNEEAQFLADFIWTRLDWQWDDYTNHYICKDTWEEGMRRMSPEAYKMYEQLQAI